MAAKTATKRKTSRAKVKGVSFHKDFRPGKGLSVTPEVWEKMVQIDDLLADLTVEGRTVEEIESMLKRGFGDPIEVDLKYGKKWLVRCFDTRDGEEFRLALVVRPNGDLKIDARTWYDPNRG